MRLLSYLLSRKVGLFSGILFSLSLPTISLIVSPQVKAEPSSQALEMAQNEKQVNTLLEKKGKDFIGLLNSGKYQQAVDYLAPEIKTEFNANKAKQVWENLIERYGKYKNISYINSIDAVNVNLLKIEVNFANSLTTITLVFNKKDQIIGLNVPQNQKDDSIEQLANKFVDNLAKGDYLAARSNLHPYLKAEFSPETIEKRWKKIDKQFGGFQQRLETNSEPGDTPSQADIAIVTIEFNDTVRNMLLIFDSEKQIIGIDFENIFEK